MVSSATPYYSLGGNASTICPGFNISLLVQNYKMRNLLTLVDFTFIDIESFSNLSRICPAFQLDILACARFHLDHYEANIIFSPSRIRQTDQISACTISVIAFL